MNSPSDRQIIGQVLVNNDRDAFGVLVRRYQSMVRGMLRKLTGGDEALADDIAQETFVLAFVKLATFRGEARFSTWIYRIAYRKFLVPIGTLKTNILRGKQRLRSRLQAWQGVA